MNRTPFVTLARMTNEDRDITLGLRTTGLCMSNLDADFADTCIMAIAQLRRELRMIMFKTSPDVVDIRGLPRGHRFS